jgi:SM-20-related protein
VPQSTPDHATEPAQRSFRQLAPGVLVIDNLLHTLARKQILTFLRRGAWQFGWKSKGSTDTFSFWHLHFAGHRKARHEEQYECSGELEKSPLLHEFWRGLRSVNMYRGHSLVRCYANGQCYGSDGTVHTDSKSDKSYTAVYYPHDAWSPNWGGETMIFAPDLSDVLATIYPRPNRLAIFKGKLPHVARGVSRTCPELRITLMFKTDVLDDQRKAEDVPAGAVADTRDPP